MINCHLYLDSVIDLKKIDMSICPFQLEHLISEEEDAE